VATVQQGQTFAWAVADSCSGVPYCFDVRARPTRVAQGASPYPPTTYRVEDTVYHDDSVRWILGQVAQRTVDGIVAAQTTFDANAQPWKTYAFGKLQQTLTYNADGTLATVADGNNNATAFASWKRGIPQSIHFPATPESPAGATRAAVVNDQGWITAVTDEAGFATSYAYDTMGRISQVTYPAGDTVAWAPTTSVFEPVAGAEYGIAAGHWRQTVSTGNARKLTYFDALWRPLLVREYDSANVAGTDRYAATAYDNASRVADAAYPLGTAPTLASDGTWRVSGVRPNGVRTSYDALGRPTSVVQDSELGLLTTTTQYLTGFQRRTTDARGHATTESFMAWDTPDDALPVQVDAPEAVRTTIARDAFGKPTAITRGATP
jgi:YD repeat-containing protein